jgi:hypothetical protein
VDAVLERPQAGQPIRDWVNIEVRRAVTACTEMLPAASRQLSSRVRLHLPDEYNIASLRAIDDPTVLLHELLSLTALSRHTLVAQGLASPGSSFLSWSPSQSMTPADQVLSYQKALESPESQAILSSQDALIVGKFLSVATHVNKTILCQQLDDDTNWSQFREALLRAYPNSAGKSTITRERGTPGIIGAVTGGSAPPPKGKRSNTNPFASGSGTATPSAVWSTTNPHKCGICGKGHVTKDCRMAPPLPADRRYCFVCKKAFASDAVRDHAKSCATKHPDFKERPKWPGLEKK